MCLSSVTTRLHADRFNRSKLLSHTKPIGVTAGYHLRRLGLVLLSDFLVLTVLPVSRSTGAG
jgi:hypothetical protein